MKYSRHDFFAALVPGNFKGKEITLSESSPDEELQIHKDNFRQAVNTLLRPGKWNDIAGGAKFSIRSDEHNEKVINEKDFIRIDIPGPGPSNGDGYDWVVVEKLIDQSKDEEFPAVGLLLKASADPDNANSESAHFFAKGASSTIVIFRESNKIIAQYFGRNEEPNIHTDSIITNIRNTMVAAGAMLGLSEVQWASLLKGLLSK